MTGTKGPLGAEILINGARLHVVEAGAGTPVVFSHGGFMTHRIFDALLADLAPAHRCIAYDHRGQGQSEFGRPHGESYVETVYEDAVALLRELDVRACHWIGQSLGTFVGMRLAARRPELIRSLVLLSPRIRRNPQAVRMRVEGLFAALRVSQLVPAANHALRYRLADYLMNEVYGSSFMSDPSRAADRRRLRDQPRSPPRAGASATP